MNKVSAALLGVVIISGALLSETAPSFALGGCGPNHHRSSVSGRCIRGGQNQDWCLRHTGRPAVRLANGTLHCVR